MGWMRYPRTTAERRASQGRGGEIKIDNYRIKIRARRNVENLTDAWDDGSVSTLGHRSWKRHRKTQWKNR
jgi:hypothetical protein